MIDSLLTNAVVGEGQDASAVIDALNDDPLSSDKALERHLSLVKRDAEESFGHAGVLLITDRLRGLSSIRSLVQQSLSAAPDVVVVETRTGEESEGRTRRELDDLLTGLDPPLPQFASVAPREALAATEAMRRGNATEFSRRYIGSGIPQLSDQLIAIARRSSPAKTATTLAVQASTAILVQLGDEAAMLAEASDAAAVLEAYTERVKREAKTAILQDGSPPADETRRSREAIDRTINKRLSWWKLPLGRIDDIRAVLAYALEASFLRTYETELAFKAGRLAGITSIASERVDALLANSPFAPSTIGASSLYSAVLVNDLAQIMSRPSSQLDLTPDILSKPIATRRAQLLARGGPVEHLQRKAQLALVRSGVVFLGGPMTAYLAYQASYLSAASLGGLSTLALAFSAWLLQRGYSKAVNKFFGNYERVIEGLGHDIERQVDTVLDEVVFAKSYAAIKGIRELIVWHRTNLNASLASANDLQTRAISLQRSL